MTPDVLTVLLAATVGMGVIVAVFVGLASERRIEPRRAVRPPVDGARVAGPGAVPPPPPLPYYVDDDEPHRPGRLVRPFLTRIQQVADTPATAPMALPTVPVEEQEINGRRVVLLFRCGICRDGRSLLGLNGCPWCSDRVKHP